MISQRLPIFKLSTNKDPGYLFKNKKPGFFSLKDRNLPFELKDNLPSSRADLKKAMVKSVELSNFNTLPTETTPLVNLNQSKKSGALPFLSHKTLQQDSCIKKHKSCHSVAPLGVEELIAKESIKLLTPGTIVWKHLNECKTQDIKFKLKLIDNIIEASHKISQNNLSVKKNFEVINDFYSKLKKKVRKKRKLTQRLNKQKTVEFDENNLNQHKTEEKTFPPEQGHDIDESPESHKSIQQQRSLADRITASNRFSFQVKLAMKKAFDERAEKKRQSTIVQQVYESEESEPDTPLARANLKAEALRLKQQIKTLEKEKERNDRALLLKLTNKNKSSSKEYVDEKGPERLLKLFNSMEHDWHNKPIDFPTLRTIEREANTQVKLELAKLGAKQMVEKDSSSPRNMDRIKKLKPKFSVFNLLQPKRKGSAHKFTKKESNRKIPNLGILGAEAQADLKEVLEFFLFDKFTEEGAPTIPEPSLETRRSKNREKTKIFSFPNSKAKGAERSQKVFRPIVKEENKESEEDESMSIQSSASEGKNELTHHYSKLKTLNNYLEIVDEKYRPDLEKFRSILEEKIERLEGKINRIVSKRANDSN